MNQNVNFGLPIEYVYTKNFDEIHFDGVSVDNFRVEIGNMEYGLDIEKSQ